MARNDLCIYTIFLCAAFHAYRAHAFLSSPVPIPKVCSLSSGPVHKSSSTTSPFLPHAIATPPQGSEEGSPRSDKTGATGASSSTVASFSPFMGRQTKRSGLLFQEEINFCLPASESMASNLAAAAAIARTANSFANQAAKKILIGVDCCFQDIADLVKERLATDYGESNQDVLAASSFIDAVSALSPCSKLKIDSTKAALQAPYDKAYDRVVETLMGANCELRSGDQTDAKVVPRDRDFCLSLYDTLTSQSTKTKVLNLLSNRVARTMLYGDEEDVGKLTKELESGQQAFLDKWVGGEKESDEALYYSSLIAQLTGGLEAPVPSMRGGYGNAYQRLMAMLVQELGSRSAPVDGELFDSFVRWETSLRKNLTQEMWDPHPKELTGQWTLIEQQQQQQQNNYNRALAPLENPSIGFRRDGSLRLPIDFGLDGTWEFEPGPTHLDTIRFEIRLATPDSRILEYTGYVDRGQRIETRFSKRPIKMNGRMIVKVRGEPISSSKFSMALNRKEKLAAKGAPSRGARRE